jgi:hypothetical protein
MAGDPEAGRDLARRLRSLRQVAWPGVRVKQGQVAVALKASVPLISSWERSDKVTTPPEGRLRDYARFFATVRSLDDGHPHLLPDDDLTTEERELRRALEGELIGLRVTALGLAADTGDGEYANRLRASVGATPWRFPVGDPITIVPARLPKELLARVPSSDPVDPDYVESYRYGDLDSIFELHGHLRAVNPDNLVKIKLADELLDDDRSTHLVLLGGVDWNRMTRQIVGRLGVPIRQTARDTPADSGGFAIAGTDKIFEPSFDEAGALTEDVACFVRAPNPYNRASTLTICNAQYALGVYGVVRALTDAQFRDRNAEYLRSRFARSDVLSILCHVRILAGAITVPDWTLAENRLHEWPEADE